MPINFTKRNWLNGPGGGTPIDAVNLNRLEDAIEDLAAQVGVASDGSSISVADNGDGTFTLSDSAGTNVTDNGDGTLTISA